MAWQHSLPPEPNDFFAIGGDSLASIQLVTPVRDHPAVSARCIAFTHPTLRRGGAQVSWSKSGLAWEKLTAGAVERINIPCLHTQLGDVRHAAVIAAAILMRPQAFQPITNDSGKGLPLKLKGDTTFRSSRRQTWRMISGMITPPT